MIELISAQKRFGAVLAVNDVSFTAADGVVTGVLGPNGAGKTTSLRMASALFLPDGGEARIDGVSTATGAMAARKKLGVLPHHPGVYNRLTPFEHALFAGRLHGMTDDAIRERFTHLARLLEMTTFMDRRCDGFSQGQKLKTAIARALIHSPKNVVLDEPTAGLDVKGTRAMREVILELKAQGHCVIFSTHVMQEVAALCDHIVIVAAGKNIAQGSPDALRAQTGRDSLEDAFVAVLGSDEGLH